jgi:hypothetical protein
MTVTHYDNWAFKVFLCSTLFIVIFSVTAIHSWPPLAKHVSILLACILPVAIAVLKRIPVWFREKNIPKEVLWTLLVFLAGIISSILSENAWTTMKSTVLFVASGPVIFVAARYLFESVRNQEIFLWTTSLLLLSFGFWGVYEYNYSGNILLFTDNRLSAGASLILLSTSPMVLLTRKCSTPLRLILILSLISSSTLIILLAKKGPILSLIVIFLFSVFFITRKHLWALLGFALLAGCLLLTSESTISQYKSLYKLNSSITLRAEHYFFGFHVLKKNPIWGVGYHANLFPYFYCDNTSNREDLCANKFNYDPTFFNQKRGFYWGYHTTLRTFDNIVLTFLVEMGGLFSAIYFGGVIYIFTVFFKNFRAPPQKNVAGMFIIAVIVGFAFISCTFDTLRFPNLNWLFHSFLGLMVNLPQNSTEKQSLSG